MCRILRLGRDQTDEPFLLIILDRSAAAESQRFIETARALGVDEDEDRFREKLRVIARQKPKDEKPKPKKD